MVGRRRAPPLAGQARQGDIDRLRPLVRVEQDPTTGRTLTPSGHHALADPSPQQDPPPQQDPHPQQNPPRQEDDGALPAP